MHGIKQHGLDYTPLYKFLLFKVGRKWDEVYSEAIARLDKKNQFFGWLQFTIKIVKITFVQVNPATSVACMLMRKGLCRL